MKLDDLYFNRRLIDLLNCFSYRKHLKPEPNDGYKPELAILRQIAADARREQVKIIEDIDVFTFRNVPMAINIKAGILAALKTAQQKED